MRVIVDMAKCQDHGQCAIAAPDVFRINDQGSLEYETSPAEEVRDDIEEAADVCPVQAILVEN
ncbi:ferredoxin [Catenulispora rubra]|uniref:ferredoxin n=1 Tax=Catenulispora rubra TaxID=280293 RepID=UPI0018925C90|nr:ferredoxin [Catenulispora rubra]